MADELLNSESVTVFVMGPDTTADKPGAKLRQEIINLCNREELAVKAEHKDIITEAKRKLKAGFTLTDAELFMAKTSDLIVIIPDSAGSIAELGYFAQQPKLCPNMIILFDMQYLRRKKSYIAQGPRQAAKNSGATVRFVDYRRPLQAWDVIRRRIEIAKASKVRQRLEMGYGAIDGGSNDG